MKSCSWLVLPGLLSPLQLHLQEGFGADKEITLQHLCPKEELRKAGALVLLVMLL